MVTFTKRGGYSEADAVTYSVQGPGVLFVTHLDLWPEVDMIKVSGDTNADWKDVYLTGNYSACIRSANLEELYMDKNLAPDSAEGVDPPMAARTSTHETEETQNHQSPQGTTDPVLNSLCHDILTGKVLGPQPIQITDQADIEVIIPSLPIPSLSEADQPKRDYSDGTFSDGYTLQYVYDDWYYVDTIPNAGGGDEIYLDGCTVGDASIGGGSELIDAIGGNGLPPEVAPTAAWFVDENLNPRVIAGKMYAEGGSNSYKVVLEKIRAPGTWGKLNLVMRLLKRRTMMSY